MQRQRILNLLGLMARARKIDVGTAKIFDGMSKNKYMCIVLATDAEPKTREKFERLCDKCQIELMSFGTKAELATAIGKSATVAIAIKDQGFNEQLRKLIGK